jgi:hypothetical protein
LPFRDVLAYLELAVYSHVVDRVQFHAVGIQLSWVGHSAGFLDFDEAAAESEELIVYREKSFRNWLGCDEKLVNVCVSSSDKIEESLQESARGFYKGFHNAHSLRMQVRRLALGVEEIAVSSRVINAVKLPLPHEQICFSQ